MNNVMIAFCKGSYSTRHADERFITLLQHGGKEMKEFDGPEIFELDIWISTEPIIIVAFNVVSYGPLINYARRHFRATIF